MATDALSDVLRAVRLAGAVYFDVAARAPWVAEQPPREMVLPKILPGAGHLISYHVVTEGSCFAGLIGAEPIAVEAGEVIVFTKGDPHVMSSSPGMRANPVTPDAFDEAAASPLPFSVNYGGISRTANSFWKSTYVHGAGNVTPTRNLMLQFISQVSKTTGEMPTIGIMIMIISPPGESAMPLCIAV